MINRHLVGFFNLVVTTHPDLKKYVLALEPSPAGEGMDEKARNNSLLIFFVFLKEQQKEKLLYALTNKRALEQGMLQFKYADE